MNEALTPYPSPLMGRGGLNQRFLSGNKVKTPMKIVVLGGGGFIGTHIVRKLQHAGYHVRVFEQTSLSSLLQQDKALEWVYGDIRDDHDLHRALDGMDTVIHLVSTTLPKTSNEDPVFDVQSNLLPTLRLLEIMREKKLRKIVFASSGGTVYGLPQYQPIDEKHPAEPACSYGIVKLSIEKYLSLYQLLHGIEPIVLRLSNPYGEGQSHNRGQGIIAAFAHKIVTGQPIEIWGDGSIVRDYIHIDDVAEAFLRVMKYSGQSKVFNISSGQGISINTLLARFAEMTDQHINCIYKSGRPFDVPVNILSNALAVGELGWKPSVSLAEGLRRTLAWAASQPS